MKKKISTKKRTSKTPVKRKQPTKPKAASPERSATPTEDSKTSKKDIVIALLRRENGATLAELRTATGWQAHSVRGFISGTLRKKLGLTIQSSKGAERTYSLGETDQQ